MNRIILALAALVGQATAFAPAVAPRPATQLQASKFDAGAKAAASLAASIPAALGGSPARRKRSDDECSDASSNV